MTATTRRALPPEPGRATWVPAAVALVAVLAGVALALSVRHRLPDPLVVHWGADGRPNGYSSLGGWLWFGSLLVAAMTALLVVVGRATRQARIMGPLASGLSVFMSTVFFGMLWLQRDGRDARGADWQSILIGLPLAAIVGLLTWRATRSAPSQAAARPDGSGRTLAVGPAARVAWTGRTSTGLGTWLAPVVASVPLLGMGIWFATLGNVGSALVMAVVYLGLLVLMSSLLARVRIDARGLRVSSFGVLPWADVPLASITGASVEPKVHPLSDYGGWGIRGGMSGERAIVTAAGPALRIGRAGDSDLVVTVPDAEAAAATLRTLLQQTRG